MERIINHTHNAGPSIKYYLLSRGSNIDIGDDYDFMGMEDDSNINKPPASFSGYSQVEYQLSKGRKTLDDELDKNLVASNTHYKTTSPEFEQTVSKCST